LRQQIERGKLLKDPHRIRGTENGDRARETDAPCASHLPTITFRSSHVVGTSPETYAVTGTLTIHGVAKEITLPVTYLGSATDPWGNARAGFETETTINRKDFGLHWNAALETGGFLLGDDVRIGLSIQAIAQREGL
jgi:polyisoprenoid-binding protein YceI